MYSFTYENQGANSYLVYTLKDNEIIDSMSFGMITNNKIPGLASTMFMQMNAARYLKYNISSKIPASQFFSGPVNKKRLLGVFSGIVDAMLSAEEYMLDIQAIILDLDYIYADVASGETVLICLPVEKEIKNEIDLNFFFKNIMFGTQFDQTENCDYVTRIINYLNSAFQFSLIDFKTLLEELIHSREQERAAVYQSDFPQKQPDSGLRTEPAADFQSEPQPLKLAEAEQEVSKQAAPSAPPVQQTEQESSADKKENSMSLYYLLRHYDKENANIYKAQKAEKKSNKASEKSEKKEKRASRKDKHKPNQAAGFAIPGQKEAPPHVPAMDVPNGTASAPGEVKRQKETEKSTASQPQAHWSSDQQPPVAGGMGIEVDFGDTVYEEVQGSSSETVIMGVNSSEQQIRPHLIRKRNNEVIPINKPIFRLGRNYEYNDYMIAENEYVGNSHCHIITRDGEYFIVDDNSKNHTYVNGVMLLPGTEVKLTHGLMIRLANEEFEFRLF